jgi:hypothetical protein
VTTFLHPTLPHPHTRKDMAGHQYQAARKAWFTWVNEDPRNATEAAMKARAEERYEAAKAELDAAIEIRRAH